MWRRRRAAVGYWHDAWRGWQSGSFSSTPQWYRVDDALARSWHGVGDRVARSDLGNWRRL